MTATMNQPAPAIARDRWGRPLITPIGGGKPIGYTRVSTLAKAIDDTEGLTQWKLRQAIIGLTRRSDLISLAASKTDDKATLNRVAKEAMDAADSGAAANTGTALHSFTETADLKGDLTRVPTSTGPTSTPTSPRPSPSPSWRWSSSSSSTNCRQPGHSTASTASRTGGSSSAT